MRLIQRVLAPGLPGPVGWPALEGAVGPIQSKFAELIAMAVQKSRVTPSRRGQRRSHDALRAPTLAVDKTSGETHRRHHVTKDGFYRGRQVIAPKVKRESDED